MKVYKKILFLILLILLASPAVLLAGDVDQGDVDVDQGGGQGGAQAPANKLTVITNNVKNLLWYIGGTLVVVGWTIAGILYLTSIGSQTKMDTAKKAIIAAIIGTVLIVFASSSIALIELFNNILLQGL
jgi:hypothetical protein